MVIPFRSPGVPPGILIVVAAPAPPTVRGDGIVEGAKKGLDFYCSVWVFHKASKREADNIPVLGHVSVEEVVDLLGRGHLVHQVFYMFFALMRFTVGQGPVVVAGPQFLEGLSGFAYQEVEVEHVLPLVEDSDRWPVPKVEVGHILPWCAIQQHSWDLVWDMIGLLKIVLVFNGIEELDVLEGDVAERVFTHNIAGIARDPDHGAIKVPLGFWDKEVGQLTLEVWAHEGQEALRADIADEGFHSLFSCVDLGWCPVNVRIDRSGGRE